MPRKIKAKCQEMALEAERFIHALFSKDATKFSTTVSSVAWEIIEGTGVVTISGTPTVAANGDAQALIVAATMGCAVIRAQATLADTQKVNAYIEIEVVEPSCSTSG